jgi:hypothetical protein
MLQIQRLAIQKYRQHTGDVPRSSVSFWLSDKCNTNAQLKRTARFWRWKWYFRVGLVRPGNIFVTLHSM